jgi:hypothetical protein
MMVSPDFLILHMGPHGLALFQVCLSLRPSLVYCCFDNIGILSKPKKRKKEDKRGVSISPPIVHYLLHIVSRFCSHVF